MRIENELSKLEPAMAALAQYGQTNGIDQDIRFDLCLALEEITTNIIKYAFDDDRNHFITVALSVDSESITMEIRDNGKPFNPIENAAPDFKRSFQEKSRGGVGLYLVTQLMDETAYSREYGENIFVMKKSTLKVPRSFC